MAGHQPHHILAVKDDVSGFLGVQLDMEQEHQHWDLVNTPGALGVHKANPMVDGLVMMVQLSQVAGLLLAAFRLDGVDKRGEGGAPHLD